MFKSCEDYKYKRTVNLKNSTMSNEEKIMDLKSVIDILIVSFLEFILILGVSVLFLSKTFKLILIIEFFLGYLYQLYYFRYKTKL